ncbi:MAG: terminase small subunit [Clostridium sp.]|uniref:terminase small subunit n=1 Tax=Clostridium innocuum TaxID=1522 RepID=UPI001E415A90|nr:terminase small subunit [[Clostridium] innocuum]MCC2834697.1 terminase small subunit [[Clostridium] innocuum]MCR0262157.1 terminase small subunit [[Clostridium] innocuum]MCR0505642.1 terminase small subunit [[Clostridium] innocuum]
MEKDNKASDAYKDYRKGMKYKDIADKYNVSLNTVKSWKRRQWADIEKGVQPKKKSVHTKRTPKESSNAPPKEELLPEEIETLNNEELTERQRLFCLYYVRWFNATKAYRKVYDCDYTTAMTNGSMLLRNTKIQEHIQAIKDAKIKQAMYTAEDFFQKMMDIAYSDATDFLSFGRRKDKKTGLEYNYVDFLDSSEIDGTLIQEVKQGKDGCSIKLVSKEFALKWLDKHYSEATDLQKAQIEQLRAQTDKLKADRNNAPDESVQDKMDAIAGIVDQMQPLEDDDV